MKQVNKSDLYKVLNDTVVALTGEMVTGVQSVYVTVDRARYNELLASIKEAKQDLIRPDENSEF